MSPENRWPAYRPMPGDLVKTTNEEWAPVGTLCEVDDEMTRDGFGVRVLPVLKDGSRDAGRWTFDVELVSRRGVRTR